jgi:hypothetical protein
MIFRYLVYAFLIYLGYRLVFHLIIPMARTLRQVKMQFDEVGKRMQEEVGEPLQTDSPGNNHASAPVKESDYIDFEEIKS